MKNGKVNKMTKVNKRKITKTMCYNLVATKRMEILKEKHEPFNREMTDKIQSIRRGIIEDTVPKNKIEQIVEQADILNTTLEGIRDDLEYSYYIREMMNDLRRFNSERIYNTLGDSINTKNSEIERIHESIHDDKSKYMEEFDKIHYHLKSLKTGGQCYDFLKGIGFDVTPLEEQVEKYELSPIEVNKDLLGLPEVSK